MSLLRLLAVVAVLLGLESCDDSTTAPDPADFPTQMVGPETWAGISKLTCRPTRADVCGPEGCKEQEPKAWIEVVDPSSPTLRRCTATGCDATKAQVSYSGAFANINIPGNASFVRLTANDAYMETVSLMDTVLIYRGQCERAR